MLMGSEHHVRVSVPCRIAQALGLRSENARRRLLMGSEGVVGEVGDCTLSLELEMLPEEAERRRDSSIVSSRLTFA